MTTQDNLLLQQIEQNERIEVQLGKKTIRIKRMTNAIAERFDRYTAEAEISYGEKGLLINMSNNRKLVPKCVSLLILHSWIKVKLFHWIYWRWLHVRYSQQELKGPLMGGLSLGEFQDLASCLVCLQDNSQMIQKAAKGIIRNTLLVQGSEQEQKQ